jgi:hypothetical protein
MNPFGSNNWPSYLNYGDAEQVRLNLTAIISEGSRLRRKRLMTKAAAAALVCGIVPGAVIIGAAGTTERPSVTAGPQVSAYRFGINLRQSSVRTSVSLPHQYQRVSSLAGDQVRPGVWFWGKATSRISLFHLNRDGALQTWTVLPLTRGLRVGASSGFTVTPSGVAWLGLNSTLIRVETRTGRVRSWPIPASRPGDDTGRPAVEALAANADGQIAVAMSHSSAIQVFSQRTGRFTEVKLPTTTDQPRSIAFARDGTLGVSFTDAGRLDRAGVYLMPRTGPLFVSPVDDAVGVTPFGASSLIVGVARPDLVSTNGYVTHLVGPGDMANLDVAAAAPARLPDNKLTTVVAAGYLSYPVGAQSVTQAKTSSVLYLAAPNSCGTVSVKLPGSAATQPTEPTSSSCPWPFRLLTSDSTGDVWVVPAASKRTVELLKK